MSGISALLLLAVACTGGEAGVAPRPASSPTPSATRADAAPFIEAACALPPSQLTRVLAGYDPGRSGEIQLLPEEPNVVGQWLSHSGPWPYVQRIPMLFYGPPHVPGAGVVNRAATLADVAPTIANLVDYDFRAPDGTALEEIVGTDDEPPRLVVVMVWDAAGRNVLDEHPDAWPTLRSLIPEGVWVDRATVGSSPSVTPAAHATIGTGAMPRRHGLVDLRYRLGRRLRELGDESPTHLRSPTLADRYDRDRDNRPVIGAVSSAGTLGLVGHGSSIEGGDRDVVLFSNGEPWEHRKGFAPFFRLPAYANEVPGRERAIRELDLEDGALDGRWMGEPFTDDPKALAATPAWSDYQMEVLEEVIRREGFGDDAVPDLLFTNFKQIDNVSHLWNMHSPQMEAVVRSTDAALARLIDVLDREVGKGEWVLAVVADHGAAPAPDVSGGFIIDLPRLTRQIRERFDGDGDDREAIEATRVTQFWVDEEELAEHGGTLAEVARFLLDYTKGDNLEDPTVLPRGDRDDPVFDLAVPGEVLESLPCA